jgi:SAM-dependent methyltransferase
MRPTEELFDREEEYDAMLARGLRLTGEDKHYFIRGRLALLRALLPAGPGPTRILDFGCGTGDSTAALAEAFPAARVTGVDTSRRALDHAARTHGGERVGFGAVADLDAHGAFDLCFVNGVFHHIPPASRPRALACIRAALRPDGLLALFENNPWNPGTRLVMRRIPFDRDARTISPRAARALLRGHGFRPAGPRRHLFFFPAALAALRRFEPLLRWLPLGGQYLVLARVDAARAGPGGG